MLEPHRGTTGLPMPMPMPTQIPAPKPSQLTRWITVHPDALTDEEDATLAEMDRRCPHLAELRDRVTAFAVMLTRRTGDQDLEAWIETTGAAGHRAVAAFARGLRDDHDVVLAGLTLPYSSGPVESNVTRIKAIKRQMYGRAGFPLLRKRVLLNY
jgi:transposase